MKQTLGFADFAGNKQYITLGNIQENLKAHVFLMDYAHRRRIKIWGELSAVEGDAALNARLKPEGYKARVERVMLIKDRSVGCELPAAHSAENRCGGRHRGACEP